MPAPPIRRVSVLGAGTMGAQIAAHFANAGVPVLLLDVTRQAAREGLERARKLKPDPFFLPAGVNLIETGGFDDDLAAIGSSDWIVEAIVERLDAKRALFENVDRHRAPDAPCASGCAGSPIITSAKGWSSRRTHPTSSPIISGPTG